MKLLSTSIELTTELSQLLKRYQRFSCAVAWAGTNFPLEKLLHRNRHKLNHAVVGTHFFQTHPDFIKRYRRNPNVRFVLQTDGVFHPKLYYFENSPTDWACVIGSPNFTAGGFHRNVEVAAVFDAGDLNAEEAREQIQAFIVAAWAQSVPATK